MTITDLTHSCLLRLGEPVRSTLGEAAKHLWWFPQGATGGEGKCLSQARV